MAFSTMLDFGNSSAIEYDNLLVLTQVALPQSFYAFYAIRSFLVIIARSYILISNNTSLC